MKNISIGPKKTYWSSSNIVYTLLAYLMCFFEIFEIS